MNPHFGRTFQHPFAELRTRLFRAPADWDRHTLSVSRETLNFPPDLHTRVEDIDAALVAETQRVWYATNPKLVSTTIFTSPGLCELFLLLT